MQIFSHNWMTRWHFSVGGSQHWSNMRTNCAFSWSSHTPSPAVSLFLPGGHSGIRYFYDSGFAPWCVIFPDSDKLLRTCSLQFPGPELGLRECCKLNRKNIPRTVVVCYQIHLFFQSFMVSHVKRAMKLSDRWSPRRDNRRWRSDSRQSFDSWSTPPRDQVES